MAPSHLDVVRRRAALAGVPLRTLGRTGGARLVVDGLLDVDVEALARTWRDVLPVAFGGASTS